MYDLISRKSVLTQARPSGWFTERATYRASVAVIIVAAVVIRAPSLWISSIDWDEGVYLAMAQQWLLSHLPYIGVWDQHPPGLPALFLVTQLMIGDPVLGARLAGILVIIITALLLHRFGAVHFGRPAAGMVSALLYIVCISRWLGLAANTEIFNNAFVTAAAYLLCRASAQPTRSLPRAISAALLLGLGLQIKYTIVPESILFCLAYIAALYQQCRNFRAVFRVATLLGLAGFLPTFAVILYFWSQGAIQPFIDANLSSNIAYLEIIPSLSAIVHSTGSGMAPIIGCILILGYRIIQNERWMTLSFITSMPHIWLLLWIIASAANVCLPLKFFNHYYFGLYPPMCLAGALALSNIARGRFSIFATGVMILFATAVPYVLMAEARTAHGSKTDAPRAIAQVLRQDGARDVTVFVYDYTPVVYALARVRPPTRYVLSSELNQYSHSAQVDGVSELERIMDTSPDFVVKRERILGETGWVDLDRLITSRLCGYHVVYQIVDSEQGAIIRIYRR